MADTSNPTNTTESMDELKFQDFSLDAAEKGTRTVAYQEDKDQIHTFTSFPETAVDQDDEDKSDDTDGQRKTPSYFSIEYYQQFFDIDSKQVLYRIAGSMFPRPGRNFIIYHLRPNPDIYGPFWVCVTLIFCMAVGGNLSNYFNNAGAPGFVWHTHFGKLTTSAAVIFVYWWLIPAIIYGLLRWKGNVGNYRYLEVLCLYGYSLSVYIPASILWLIQVNWLQWIVVMVAMVLSGGVLAITFWPALRDVSRKMAVATIVLVLGLHALLALGFMLFFFHVSTVDHPATNGTITTTEAIITTTLTAVTTGSSTG